jgi:NADPH2:quinone reductase
VGNAAIQLARWAGADVLTTVSTPEKARLATAAGAQHVVDYRAPDAVDQLREAAPDGIHLVVDVSVAANLPMDLAVLVPGGTVAGYAADAGTEAKLGVRELMVHNTRLQFVLVYTVPAAAKERAVADVAAAVADGALRVGESAGLPLHRFPLERCADAHAAVEKSAIGKVLIDVVDRE